MALIFAGLACYRCLPSEELKRPEVIDDLEENLNDLNLSMLLKSVSGISRIQQEIPEETAHLSNGYMF